MTRSAFLVLKYPCRKCVSGRGSCDQGSLLLTLELRAHCSGESLTLLLVVVLAPFCSSTSMMPS